MYVHRCYSLIGQTLHSHLSETVLRRFVDFSVRWHSGEPAPGHCSSGAVHHLFALPWSGVLLGSELAALLEIDCCVCVCVCMRMCMCVCACTYTHVTYTHVTCMCTCLKTIKDACKCLCVCTDSINLLFVDAVVERVLKVFFELSHFLSESCFSLVCSHSLLCVSLLHLQGVISA